jgi:tripartite ATP-independent transporter DctP family solute receptor
VGKYLHLCSRKISKVSGLFILLFILSACQAHSYPEDHEQLSQEERIVIRFSHVVGEDTPKGLAARRFAKLMKERTNGYVEVQVFPNGYLYKDGEELEALQRGDIQMIAPATSKITSLVPEWQVMDLPFAFQNVEEVHDYLNGSAGKVLMNKLKPKGMYPLDIWDNGFKQMTSNHNALIHPDDFEGLRFRIMPSQVLHDQFTELKALPQPYSFNEVFQLLENNEIDGQENTASNITSKNLHSMQDYMTVSNHGYLGYLVLINIQFWEQLPDDIKKTLEETLAEVTEWEMDKAKELHKQELQSLEQCQCISIHVLTEEERQQWEDALQPVYQKFSDRFGANYIDQLPKYR